MFRGKYRRIHFVGIGGIGMSGIAEVLITLGFNVSGSDLKESATLKRLRAAGATVFIGHRPENVDGAEVLVRSSAVPDDNPEVAVAIRKLIPVIHRAEMLAELMRMKYGLAVAGSHGKTTTTSMLATCLAVAGLDPTVVIGGRLDNLGGSNARLGVGDYLVAEADESDGSFLLYSPTVALVTNIDPEHMEHFKTVENLEDSFLAFCNRVPFYGYAVMCQDHPAVQRLISRVRRRVVTYGFARSAQYRGSTVQASGLRTTFRVHYGDVALGEISLGMPGIHNVSNAVGAIAVCMELGIAFDVLQKALHGFTGVQRRFTVRAEVAGVMIVDDYGHHPTEIDATLAAAESGFPDRRVIAVFQPHRFTRVQSLWNEFQMAFNRADHVLVCPVYAAGEKPIEGVDSRTLAEQMRERGHRGAMAVDDLDAATAWLAAECKPGDIVITLGAGDVNRICDDLAGKLAGGP
jgi:UDP-N-acetylmuramate--alanine ligase